MSGLIRVLRDVLRPRSNGIAVGRGTLRAIRRGDRARLAGDWAEAAAAYRAAVTRDPGLAHMWIQLGHALKEAGDGAAAEEAYRQAATLAPHDAEPYVHLGHMLARAQRRRAAAEAFVAALARDPADRAIDAALLQLLPDCHGDPALWARALAVLAIDPEPIEPGETPQPAAGGLLIDVSDLLAYFGERRLPTGIQRVQIEVALACLDDPAGGAMPCVYAGPDRRWIALPPARFAGLCRMALLSDDAGDPGWRDAVRRLWRALAQTPSLAFAGRCVMVNLGTSWGDRTYLPQVMRERGASGLVYVSFVYDLIPVRNPEWFVPDLVRDYRRWLGELLHTADGYLTISEATRADLLAARVGTSPPVPPERARVVRIDGDFRSAEAAPLPVERLADRGLAPGGFVLMVSTIEPRKNHLGAFNAWLALAEGLEETALPDLVCVGGKGWLNAEVHALLAAQPLLRRKVRLLSGVADDELALLYRQCRFTLYPSHYEGWGLPISESLAHGRVPAVSATSSMPEAGGDFAVYFDPADPADIAARIRPLIVDDVARRAAEARIAAGYRARPWRIIARQIADEAHGIARRVAGDQAETVAQ